MAEGVDPPLRRSGVQALALDAAALGVPSQEVLAVTVLFLVHCMALDPFFGVTVHLVWLDRVPGLALAPAALAAVLGLLGVAVHLVL